MDSISNFKSLNPFVLRLIVCTLLVFYLVSCSSSTLAPTSSSSLDSISSFTLEGVDETSITIRWKVLQTEKGSVDPTIDYTVYVETYDESSDTFTKDPNTETVYTVDLLNLGGGTPLPVDDEGGTEGVKIGGLVNDTPYRIVVEARDVFGGISRSHLFAYTASRLTDTKIENIAAEGTEDRDIVVTWDPKEGAQAYFIKVSGGGNQFRGLVLGDRGSVSGGELFRVVCPPDYPLLCDSEGQAEELENGRLRYVIEAIDRDRTVNRGLGIGNIGTDEAITNDGQGNANNNQDSANVGVGPFNFQDLDGLKGGMGQDSIEGMQD